MKERQIDFQHRILKYRCDEDIPDTFTSSDGKAHDPYGGDVMSPLDYLHWLRGQRDARNFMEEMDATEGNFEDEDASSSK